MTARFHIYSRPRSNVGELQARLEDESKIPGLVFYDPAD